MLARNWLVSKRVSQAYRPEPGAVVYLSSPSHCTGDCQARWVGRWAQWVGGWMFSGCRCPMSRTRGWHNYLLPMTWEHHMAHVPSDFTDVLFASRMAALVVTGEAPFNAVTLRNPGKSIAVRSVIHGSCNWHMTRD